MTDHPPPPPYRRLGRGMLLLAWLGLLGGLTLYFSGYLERRDHPNRNLAKGGGGEVTLLRNRAGHYLADGEIDGHPVTFLLDTGATLVAIPGDLAAELGLERGAPHQIDTANGRSVAYATRLERVRLGPIELHGVRGHITPGMTGPEVLLGMSFLRHLELIQREGKLTLRMPGEG